MRKRLCSLLLSAGLVLAVAPISALAGEPVEINFIASGPVLGVSPAGYDGEAAQNPMNGEKVTLKFQKKRGHKWVTKRRASHAVEDGLVMDAKTPTFRRGRCRIQASFAGNDTYDAAKKVNRYTCKTGMLIYS